VLLLMTLVAGLLPLGGRRPVLARLTAAPNGPPGSGALLFVGNGSAGPKVAAFLEQVGVAASAGGARLRVWAPRYGERVVVGSRVSARLLGTAARESSRVLAIAARESSQAVGLAARESARVLAVAARESSQVIAAGARAGSSRLAQSMREREVGPGEMAVALFAVVSAVAIGVVVVFALSSM
jgi:hypothetical protein